MKAEVKEIFSVDWELGRESVLSDKRVLSVNVFVGPQGQTVSQSYTVVVCNEDYVRREIRETGYFSGLWHIVMDRPDKALIEEYVRRLVESLEGENWSELNDKLRLIGKSEYENYGLPL